VLKAPSDHHTGTGRLREVAITLADGNRLSCARRQVIGGNPGRVIRQEAKGEARGRAKREARHGAKVTDLHSRPGIGQTPRLTLSGACATLRRP